MNEVIAHVAGLTAVAIVWLVIFLCAERLQRALGPPGHDGLRAPDGLDPDGNGREMLLALLRAFLKSV